MVKARDATKIIQSLASPGTTPADADDILITAAKLVLKNLALAVKQYTTLAPAADMDHVIHNLDAASNDVGVTEFTPAAGKLALVACENADNAVTVTTGAGATFDGTNNTATFGANKALLLYGISATRWLILANVGSVALSAV